MNNYKKIISKMLVVLLLVSLLPVTALADGGNVAKVGDTEYATIDEAIAAWTNNKTLTLLANVTLSDVIKLSSTEYHTLDLGTYTMTAASGKNAIEIVNNGRSSASWTLDIKADATNPGGITASGKAIVKTSGKSDVQDRPIIRFYNGVFNASNIVSHSGSNGANCPQFYFYGGEYNGTISTNRTLNLFYGGTFHGSLFMSVDSTAYTRIEGGTFKQLSNLYMSALNSNKFTIGSAKGVFDREVYVNDDGYYVVSTAKPATIEAFIEKSFPNNYLAYSKVGTEGKLNYTNAETALKNNTSSSATVTLHVDEVDMTGINFKGTIVIPENGSLKITYPSTTTPQWKVKEEDTNQEVAYTETVGADGTVTRIYPGFKLTYKDSVTDETLFENVIAAGQSAPKIEDPERAGFIFTGWYKDAACTEAWDFDKDSVDGPITLYAGWEEIPDEPIPETGDGMGLFVFAGLALISMLGMVVLKKREQF